MMTNTTDTSAEKAEAERDENEKVIAVWRGRTQRAEAERDRMREAGVSVVRAHDSFTGTLSDDEAARLHGDPLGLAVAQLRAALKEPGHE